MNYEDLMERETKTNGQT